MTKRSTSGFTLIEMLTVLVIVGILGGITLAGMHHIGRSTALHSASRQIADQVNKARNYALGNGTYVYMVVPTGQTTSDPNYPFASFGFCVSAVTNPASVGAALSNVRYVEKIQNLPTGTVFSNNVVNVATANISFPNDGTTTHPAWVLTFTPSGQVLPLARTPILFVHRGSYDPTTKKPIRTEPNYDQIEINTLIGKPVISSF